MNERKQNDIAIVEYDSMVYGRKPGSMPGEAITPWQDYSGRINYSACNEATESEIEALKIAPGKKIAAITASGGRILSLLYNEPAEIWAIDVNPCQCFLLELKIAGIKKLDYNGYTAFMGMTQSDARLETYDSLRHLLSPQAMDYFDAHPSLIKKGILYQGNLERFFRLTAVLTNAAWVRNLKKLFRFDDLDQQRQFVEKEFKNLFWKRIVPVITRRSVLHVMADDPGFMRFLPEDFAVHTEIISRIYNYLMNNLARDNHLLSMVFFGKYINASATPLYLRESAYDTIKHALGKTRIHVLNGMISDLLKNSKPGSFDCYSISDIASYMNLENYCAMVDDIIRTSRKNGRICARHCLMYRDLPAEYDRYIIRDRPLEQKFTLHDHAMIHDFMVGDIRCGG